MDYLGIGEVLTNTDLDRFVNDISVPVAQLAAQRLWVRFPGNICTDKNMYMYSLNALKVALDKSFC